MRSENFYDLLTAEMTEVNEQPIVFDELSDMGCGFYIVGDAVFVYIGGYEGAFRSGYGVWLNVNSTDAGYYVFTGNWANDMPNGEGESFSMRDENAIEKQEGYTYGLEVITSGSFRNGLVNGSINEKWVMDDGHTHNWNLTASDGQYHIVGSAEWSVSVVGHCTECDADLSWDRIAGVRGFIG
jgi:hypothetical protein